MSTTLEPLPHLRFEIREAARILRISRATLYERMHSSGPTRHRGGLTKTGNTHVRRILVEAAWNYRFPARIGESLQPRLEGQPQHIVATAWKAQIRLCARFRRLRARGVHHNKVTAAIARELCGFIWDIGRQVPVRSSE